MGMQNKKSQQKNAVKWIQEFVYCYNQLEGKVIPIIVETASKIKQTTRLSKTLTQYINRYKYKDAKDRPNALIILGDGDIIDDIIDADNIYANLQFKDTDTNA